MLIKFRFASIAALLFVATSASAQLPPAAQEALDNGIIAAKVPDYVLAIRYFEDARKIAPEASVIYFNLGLAESKIPGRELRAICWFAAYLAADPQASNAASIKEQIQILKIRSQSNISHLIANLQDAAVKTRHDIGAIGVMWAESGDIQTALKTAALAGDSWRSDAQAGIAVTQAQAGDIPGALKTAALVESPFTRSGAFLRIAAIEIENGDLAGAESSIAESKRAAQLEQGFSRANQLKDTGAMQIKAGNKTGAQATLKAAVVAAEAIHYGDPTELSQRIRLESPIADLQIAAGDIEGAKETLLLAFKNSELMTDPKDRSQSQALYIINIQAKAGDIKNALKSYQSFQKAFSQTPAGANLRILFLSGGTFDPQLQIAAAQIKAGDFTGALKMANEMTDLNTKSDTLIKIATGQARAGDFAGMMKSLNEITDPKKRSDGLPYIAYGLTDARDFAGATRVAEMIQDPDRKRYATSNIADQRAKPAPTTATPQLMTPKSPPAPLTAKEWINVINSLEENYFTDLPGYLKTLPADDADKMFNELYKSVSKMIEVQNFITNALKRQPMGQTKP